MKLWFYYPTWPHSSPLLKAHFQKCISWKRCVRQISFIGHPGKLCSMLVGWSLQFSMKGNFGGFSAEDEQKPKLVSAHPQVPWWYEKCVTEWNSIFCKLFFALCYSDIPNCVAEAKTLKLKKKYILHFSTSSHIYFSQINKFDSDSCWCFDMFLLYYQSIFSAKTVHNARVPHLFNTPKFVYGYYLYVGAIQVLKKQDQGVQCQSLEFRFWFLRTLLCLVTFQFW